MIQCPKCNGNIITSMVYATCLVVVDANTLEFDGILSCEVERSEIEKFHCVSCSHEWRRE
jgi:hypothetical protein